MNRAEALVRELRTPGIWLGGELADCPAESTGNTALDDLLPGRGWPLGGLTELVPLGEGCGELSLLIPLIARLTAAGRRIALINPPYIPYAPALAQRGVVLDHLAWLCADPAEDALWAAEQTLRSATAGAVLFWIKRINEAELRRLQLAAETGRALGFLYRPAMALKQPSPAAVRLALHPSKGGMCIEIVKARGGKAGLSIRCAPPPLRTTQASA